MSRDFTWIHSTAPQHKTQTHSLSFSFPPATSLRYYFENNNALTYTRRVLLPEHSGALWQTMISFSSFFLHQALQVNTSDANNMWHEEIMIYDKSQSHNRILVLRAVHMFWNGGGRLIAFDGNSLHSLLALNTFCPVGVTSGQGRRRIAEGGWWPGFYRWDPQPVLEWWNGPRHQAPFH